MGLRHTTLDVVKDPHAAADGQICQTVFYSRGGVPAVAQTGHGQQRADQIDAEHDERGQQHNNPDAARHKAVQHQQQRVAPFEHDNTERTPGQRRAEANIAVRLNGMAL